MNIEEKNLIEIHTKFLDLFAIGKFTFYIEITRGKGSKKTSHVWSVDFINFNL